MYTVLDKKVNDWNVIQINEGEFSGVEFTLGGIQFADEPNDDGTYSLSFEYNLVNDYNIPNVERFTQTLGDIVSSLIEGAVAHSELIMKGGIDESKN